MTGPYTTGPIIQSLTKPIEMLSDIMNHLVSKCEQSYTSRQVKDNNNLLKWKNHTIRPLAYSTIPVYTFIKDDLTRSYKKEIKTYKDYPRDGATHSQSTNGSHKNTDKHILRPFHIQLIRPILHYIVDNQNLKH